jgi:hypothetical protein
MLGVGAAGFVGCASENTGPAVPTGAMEVVSGGKIVAFTAPHDGKIYLRDESDKHVVYSADIRRDQVVKYDPSNSNVMVDGKVVAEKISDSNHDHSIFFERSDRPDYVERPAAVSNSNSGTDSAGVPVVRVPVGVQVDVQTQPAPTQPQK